MSDTPETDEEEIQGSVQNQSDPDDAWPFSAIKRGYDFARKLERAMNPAVKPGRCDHISSYMLGWHQRDREVQAMHARIAELTKDRDRHHWLCQHLSSDWMIEEDCVHDFIDMDQWEKEGRNADAPEVRKAWNSIIDNHKKNK